MQARRTRAEDREATEEEHAPARAGAIDDDGHPREALFGERLRAERTHRALREGMLRLAGREGDGAIINWLGADDVATVAPHVHAGGPDKEIVARIFVAPTTDRDTVMALGRYAIAAYLNVPVYAEFHRWLGREDQLAGMWSAWKDGDRKAALEAIPDEVVDQLIVWGSPEECREHIGRYVANGVTTPALAVLPFGLDVRQAVRDLAPR